ncbi:MAG TPA: hypothetical protein DCP90_04070 [Clostridiales bacterium]|nr:MAG: hypothetical protein A2Y22_07305 [Clostridiales bacterium GWD2_32_59]HAN09772.1 hypothetical protein [Clostridiales bacterium]
MNEVENNEEKIYLANVCDKITIEIGEKSNIVKTMENGIIELKRYMWNNQREFDNVEKIALDYIHEEEINTAELELKRLEILNRIKESPYFGRIDFEDEEYKDLMSVYIGLTNVKDDDGFESLVYDWRAPISSMYYEYGVGKAGYSAPIGQINGEIKLKRQYKIENRKIKYIFDNDLNIDDELLKEALTKNTSEKMRNIVNSIQKDQNRIIRNESDRILIVEGPAGSGKTSVALHRIAYLLYKDKKTINSRNILIFSPSYVFSNYISNVLPELGEENVMQTTFSEYAKRFLSEYSEVESNVEQLEKMHDVEVNRYLKNGCIQIKMNSKFKSILDEYIKKVENNVEFRDISIKRNVLITKEEYINLYTNIYKNIEPKKRLDKIVDRAFMLYDDGTNDEMKEGRIREYLHAEINSNIDTKQLYIDFYKDENVKKVIKETFNIENINDICEFTISSLEGSEISYEDAICLLYFKGKIEGFFESEEIKHLIIDEAQDYNEMQYEIIKNVFKKSKITILGDVNQAINPYVSYKDFSNVKEIWGNKTTNMLELTNCYRSSYEITMFTNDLLKIKNANPMNRNEGLPKIIKGPPKKDMWEIMKKDVSNMLDNNYKQIAIVCKSIKDCDEIYRVMKEKFENINCIKKGEDIYKKGIVVIPAYLAKGLEFDGVLVYSPKGSSYVDERDIKLLYVVCTRALHELRIYNESSDIGLLERIDKGLYEGSNI